MENKVSIIVPVYNCEQYIKRCIDSLITQTYHDLEIILINDGSTDNSLSVCNNYQSLDRRIRVIDKKNEGVSLARNCGISLSTGTYILFVDGDDYIQKDMVEFMVNAAMKEQADCVICGMIHSYPNKEERIFPDKREKKVVNGIDAMNEVLINKIATAGPVCKLFSKTYVKADMFPSDLTIGEDAVGVLSTLYQMRRVAFDTKPEYVYAHREGSLMSCAYSKKDRDIIEAYRRISKLFKKEDKLSQACDFREFWSCFHVLDKACIGGVDKKEVGDIIHYLRRNCVNVWRNSYVGRMRKVSLFALVIHWRLYQKIILYKNKP